VPRAPNWQLRDLRANGKTGSVEARQSYLPPSAPFSMHEGELEFL